jgi:hypothetical protein
MKKILGFCLIFLFFGTVFAFSQTWYDLRSSNFAYHRQVKEVGFIERNSVIHILFNLQNGDTYLFYFYFDGSSSLPQNGKANFQVSASYLDASGVNSRDIFDKLPATLERVPRSGPFGGTYINAEIFESTVNRSAGQFIFLFKLAR